MKRIILQLSNGLNSLINWKAIISEDHIELIKYVSDNMKLEPVSEINDLTKDGHELSEGEIESLIETYYRDDNYEAETIYVKNQKLVRLIDFVETEILNLQDEYDCDVQSDGICTQTFDVGRHTIWFEKDQSILKMSTVHGISLVEGNSVNAFKLLWNKCIQYFTTPNLGYDIIN